MRIDARELKEWEIFMELEPFGPGITNLNFGMLGAIDLNINRKKNAKAIKPKDIAFGDFSTPQQHLDPKSLKDKIISVFKGIKRISRKERRANRLKRKKEEMKGNN